MARSRTMLLAWIGCLAALAVALALHPVLQGLLPLVTLYGPVALTVWLLGWRPAALVAIAGYVVADYLFIDPRRQLSFTDSAHLVGALAYLFTCAVIVGFGEAARQ